jgi:uncharacterized protein (TIGR03437 family)
MKRIFLALATLSLSGDVLAASHYFATTAAGFVPPIDNPIALKQYLGGVIPAYDSQGNLYYASANQVWRLNADGTDTLLAGSMTAQAGGDGGVATAAVFVAILGIALDSQQNLYIGDLGTGSSTGSVRKVTPAGQISTVVPGTNLMGMTVDAAGDVYTLEYVNADFAPSLIKYSPSGARNVIVEFGGREDTVILLGPIALVSNPLGIVQVDLSSGVITNLVGPPQGIFGIAGGPDGYVYFSESTQIMKIKPGGNGALLLVAGTGQTGSSTGDGGPATQATLGAGGLAVNPLTGDVAVSDDFGLVLRVISAATGKIQTVAGAPHSSGDNGPAVLAQFQFPQFPVRDASLACDPAGNVYFWDNTGMRIRKFFPSGIVTTVAGTGFPGNSGDGGKALLASVTPGGGMVVDKNGNLYFVNGGATVTVRKIDASGGISTVVGGGSVPFADGAKALSVDFTGASSVILAADTAGNLYMAYVGADEYSHIVKIDPSGAIALIAGGQLFHPDPDGTPAKTAVIVGVSAMAVDSAGVVYFGESYPGLLRTIDSQGFLLTVAGNGNTLFNGSPIQAGPALGVQIGTPEDLVIDSSGDLIFFAGASSLGPQIVLVDKSGNLTVLAGRSLPKGVVASTGDGGDASNASFTSIGGIILDPGGDIYVSDGDTYIRKLAPYDPTHPPPFVAAGGIVGSGGSVPPLAAVAPNGDASVYGANFIAAGTHHDLSAADLVNGKVPTVLAGVCVDFGGVPAAMLNVYPNQINVQVPPNVPPGPITVQAILNCGTASAVQSNFGGVVMQTASPEFFSFLPDPVAGKNPIAAINAVTFARIGPAALIPGVTFTPAKPGDIVEAYGTGWGLTTPPVGVGVLPPGAAALAANFSLTFAGVPIPSANIFYAGVSTCCAGLYHVDFTVPQGTAKGNQPLVITVGGVASPPGAYIAVQQ